MRYVVARNNPASPSGLSIFTGSLALQASADGPAIWAPETGWLIADAFAFATEGEARDMAALFSWRAPSGASWFVLPAEVTP
ncbi:MAG: hypothetical protein J0H54_06680 [Rhizobiales bacterium]|nr:hypothetical protein [Hyphomicrobiales bacterium]